MDRFHAIVSSVKPFHIDPVHAALQTTAINSWYAMSDKLILVNNMADTDGKDFGAEFTGIGDFNPPTVKLMLETAIKDSKDDTPIAIVNSDITLTRDVLRCLQVAKERPLGRAWAATSFRYEGDPPEVVGQGLDIFVMTPAVVRHVLADVPSFMTVGRGLWDTWLNGWLRRQLKESHYFDMTPWKCVFHPEHDRPPNRLVNYSQEQVAKIMASGHLCHDGIPNTKY